MDIDQPNQRLAKRQPNADTTRQEILDAARAEFAEHGLAGARVEVIAARTRTVKRMIYYYYGSKEGLYTAVLEAAYADIRRQEHELDLDSLAPVEALRRLVAFTFDYDEAHPDFIRLVAIENIHRARHMAASSTIASLNQGTIILLERLLGRGIAAGVFRKDARAIDIHMLISSFCFFRVSNRHTFGRLFGLDLSDPELMDRHKRLLLEAVHNASVAPSASGR